MGQQQELVLSYETLLLRLHELYKSTAAFAKINCHYHIVLQQIGDQHWY
jgi:hypothetical protein